ncbi:MAG: hypothetical protein IIW48_00785, partial [Clostridia bacterium]|nr:hypothetical protein [Clostridia bacterium]
GLIVCTASELKQMESQALSYTLEHIMYILGVLESTSGNLRKGLNRRVETEMAFVRLCSPNLDSSVDALLKRVAALESMIRSGVAVRPAEQDSQSPQTQQPQAVAPSAPEKLPDGEMSCWPDVLEELKGINRPLAGVLSNSAAYIKGDHVVIYSKNESLGALLKTNNNSIDLRRAIFNVTGIKYKIGINKANPPVPNTPPPVDEAEAPADPLASFIAKAGELGVKIIN